MVKKKKTHQSDYVYRTKSGLFMSHRFSIMFVVDCEDNKKKVNDTPRNSIINRICVCVGSDGSD